jgi:hypothetical protein
MVYANGTLFVGLDYTGSTPGGGLVWSCPGLVANSCTNLDYLDAKNNKVYSLAVGAGYLWVGTQNNTLYRCDPVAPNACTTWVTTEESIPSVAYDGQGTLVTAVSVNQGDGTQLADSAVLACSATVANTCSTSMADVYVRQVTADGGEAFSMANQGGSQLPSGPWAWYNADIGSAGFAMTANSQSQLLYIPAGGPTGTAPADATRITQTATSRPGGSTVTGTCTIKQGTAGASSTYACTVRLTDGTWIITTTAVAPSGKIASFNKRVTVATRPVPVTG